MIVVGLTGSIGMGKSTTAHLFADEGIHVFDADAEVHALYGPGGQAVPLIAKAFPEAVKDGSVDRTVLSRLVLGSSEQLSRLESIVHPLVRAARARAVAEAAAAGADMIVLDIPLLFETGSEDDADVIVVVSATAAAQSERVLNRPGMSAEKYAAIVKEQVPDDEKQRRADFVVDTNSGIDAARRQVQEIIHTLRLRQQ